MCTMSHTAEISFNKMCTVLSRSSNALFQMEWQPDGSVGFRANNGKFVATKKSGHLFANSDAIEDSSKFFFYLINR